MKLCTLCHSEEAKHQLYAVVSDTGEKKLILPAPYLCDTCKKRFGRTMDKHLSRIFEDGMYRWVAHSVNKIRALEVARDLQSNMAVRARVTEQLTGHGGIYTIWVAPSKEGDALELPAVENVIAIVGEDPE